jgi:hypothetical protein
MQKYDRLNPPSDPELARRLRIPYYRPDFVCKRGHLELDGAFAGLPVRRSLPFKSNQRGRCVVCRYPWGCTEELKALERLRAKNKPSNATRNKRRGGLANLTQCDRLRPPWLTESQRSKYEYAHRPNGKMLDHTPVPRDGGKIAGLTTPTNVDFVPRRAGGEVRPNFSDAECEGYVQSGTAVWMRDVSPDWHVNWQPYLLSGTQGGAIAGQFCKLLWEVFGDDFIVQADARDWLGDVPLLKELQEYKINGIWTIEAWCVVTAANTEQERRSLCWSLQHGNSPRYWSQD